MAKASRNVRVDRDGVRVFETASRRRLDVRLAVVVVATVVVGAGAFVLRAASVPWKSPGRVVEPQSQADTGEPEVTRIAKLEKPVRPARNLYAVHVDRRVGFPNRESAGPVEGRNKDQPEVDARDVILALRASGETGGIAAFPPPGSNPPKSGIVVPEDFALPEGYVRHYQATDDGQRLAAILMFSPDYQFVDSAGNPVPLPADLIVPPEMAPPGLPIRMLRVPKHRLR